MWESRAGSIGSWRRTPPVHQQVASSERGADTTDRQSVDRDNRERRREKREREATLKLCRLRKDARQAAAAATGVPLYLLKVGGLLKLRNALVSLTDRSK